MTPQEAIEAIKLKDIHIESGAIRITAFFQGLSVAKEALEKQIPKKPDYEGDGYADGELVYDRAICPCCGNDDFEEGINNWGCKFCPDCGQALDWSDEK